MLQLAILGHIVSFTRVRMANMHTYWSNFNENGRRMKLYGELHTSKGQQS